MYGTVTGSIGMILPIEEESFDFLARVEKKMASLVGIGNLKHDKYRSFRTCRRQEASKNIIDGDLIESLLDLPVSLKQKIADELTVSLFSIFFK